MIPEDTKRATKGVLDTKDVPVDPVETTTFEGEVTDDTDPEAFDVEEALDTVQAARERRQERREAIMEAFMGLAAKNGWGNREVEATPERLEAADDLEAAGVGADSEAEAKAEMTRVTKCERDGGHTWEATGTVTVKGVEFPQRQCKECDFEQVNSLSRA